MNLRIACGLLALAPLVYGTVGPAQAQTNRTPVFQSGRILPGDLTKSVTTGLVSDVGGLTGDTLGIGANPLSIYDRAGIGLSLNTAPSGEPYQALQFGHDAAGNAVIRVVSVNGAPETDLTCDINGTVSPCFGISPLSALTIPDQTVLGNISGTAGNPYAVPLSDLFGRAFVLPDPADTYADDTSYVVLTNASRGNAREKITLGTLVHNRRVWFYPVGLVPILIDPATAGDTHRVFGAGPLIWDISHLSPGEDYIFSTDGVATAYLDVGPTWQISSGLAGQMLKLDPGQTVTIRRLTNGIFVVVSSYSDPELTDTPPGGVPITFLTGPDFLPGGQFTLPVNGGGKEYNNATTGLLTFKLASMTQASTYWIATSSNETIALDPEGFTILGLSAGQTMTIGPGVRLPVVRKTLGLFVVGEGTASFSSSIGFTRASLPVAPRYNGETATCTNCRKPGQGAGAGTGMPVWWNAPSAAWYDTTGAVAAE